MNNLPLTSSLAKYKIPRRRKTPSDQLAEAVQKEMASSAEEMVDTTDQNRKRKQPEGELDVSELQALGDAQAELADGLADVRNELRFVHRDLKHNDIRITNVVKDHPETGERHPVNVLREIIQHGMKVDLNTVMEMTAAGRLVFARWQNSRRRENGGGANSEAPKHTLMVRFASDSDTKFILDKKKSMGNFCVEGCSRPVSINKDFAPKDHIDQLRAKTVARALADKKKISMKGADIKLRGNRIAYGNSCKPWQEWIQIEKLIPDPSKMGAGWVQPEFGPDSGQGASSSYASAARKARKD